MAGAISEAEAAEARQHFKVAFQYKGPSMEGADETRNCRRFSMKHVVGIREVESFPGAILRSVIWRYARHAHLLQIYYLPDCAFFYISSYPSVSSNRTAVLLSKKYHPVLSHQIRLFTRYGKLTMKMENLAFE